MFWATIVLAGLLFSAFLFGKYVVWFAMLKMSLGVALLVLVLLLILQLIGFLKRRS